MQIAGCMMEAAEADDVNGMDFWSSHLLLVTVFVASHVDNCNAVLCGMSAAVTRRLQMVLSAAARLVGLGKYEHIKPVLRDVLHWLSVPQRIQFKTAALAFDCVRGTSPAYFSNVFHALADISGRSGLCSALRGELFVPRTRTTKLD